jgi:hypothetical protein
VREHCRTVELCARDYTDLDMVAPGKERRVACRDAARPLRLCRELRREHGDRRRRATVRASLRARRRVREQRPPTPTTTSTSFSTPSAWTTTSPSRRLELEPYTVSLADLLLTKLQIFRLNEKDVRDIVTLLADAEVSDGDASGTIDARYIGELCADDWGLFYDVATNLQRVDERVARLPLERRAGSPACAAGSAADRRHRRCAQERALALRARLGTRASWHNELDDQE